MVRALAEAWPGLGDPAQLEELGEAVEIRRQLRAREPRALPLADRLAVLLEGLVLHEREGGLLVHVTGVDVVIEDRIGGCPEHHLLALPPDARPPEALLGPQPLALDPPAPAQRPAREHPPAPPLGTVVSP